MAQPVPEVFPVSGISNMIPCSGIHLREGDARRNKFNRFVVSLLHDLKDLFLFGRRGATDDRASLVGMIAVLPRTEIDKDKIPFFYPLITRFSMRESRSFPRGNDDVESQGLRTAPLHEEFNLKGHLVFDDTF